MNATRSLYRLAAHFGSLRTALALMALLGVVALARPSAAWLGAVMAGLGLNLLAALVVHPLLRRRLPLLVFHLALMAIVLLAGAARLVQMDGRFELLQGEPFDGQMLDQAAGPLYARGLAAAAMVNEGFTIDYAPGRQRGATRNAVAWRGTDGSLQRAVIGDHRPLVIDGHRIYTSPNKGFAPMLRWLPDDGSTPLRGAVHLPSYPMHELRQSSEWTLPDGRAVWLMLQLDDRLLPSDAPARFRMPDTARLVLRLGDARTELVPGQSWRIGGGTLHYEGLRTWMGYRVSHDPTLPWLLAAALMAALSLGWHYAGAGAAIAARTQPEPVDANRESPVAEVRHA